MKRRLKPSKLNKHLVLERIGKKRGIKFSIIFTDFGHRWRRRGSLLPQ